MLFHRPGGWLSVWRRSQALGRQTSTYWSLLLRRDGKLRCQPTLASTLERGRLKYVNVTASDESSPRYAKTVIKGRGDPGTLLTAVMVVESALTLLLDELPPLAAVGGVLTPMSALGDSLIHRLRANRRIEIETGLVNNPDDEIGEDKKRR